MTGRFDRRRPAAAQHPERAVADNVGTTSNPTSPVYVPDADKAADRLRMLMTCAAECGKGSVIWSERRIVGGKAYHQECVPEPKCQKPVNKCQIATSDDGRERLIDVPPTLDDREVAEEAVQDGMRILSDAGRTQPWLSASSRKAAEADMLRNPPGDSEGEAERMRENGLSVDIRGNQGKADGYLEPGPGTARR